MRRLYQFDARFGDRPEPEDQAVRARATRVRDEEPPAWQVEALGGALAMWPALVIAALMALDAAWGWCA